LAHVVKRSERARGEMGAIDVTGARGERAAGR
jgi:hypothetical protein